MLNLCAPGRLAIDALRKVEKIAFKETGFSRPDTMLCGNWARSFLPDMVVGTAPILGTTLGEENTHGALAGRTPAGAVTFARVSTDDLNGRIRAYVGEGRFTDDAISTFGARAVADVPGLQKLMRYICKNGFEHHAAMNASRCAAILADAMETYLSWPIYHHNSESFNQSLGQK